MLVGLLPFLALASSTSALVVDSPPTSPSLSANAAATFSSLNSPNVGLGGLGSPILPSGSAVTSPSPLGNVDTMPVPDYSSLDDLPALPGVPGVPDGSDGNGGTGSDVPSVSGLGVPGIHAPSLPTDTSTLLLPGGETGPVGTPTYPSDTNKNKIPNGSGLGFTTLNPLQDLRKTDTNANTNGIASIPGVPASPATVTDDLGSLASMPVPNADSAKNRLKALTNGQRLAKGLAPLPPTRRMTARLARRSASAPVDPNANAAGPNSDSGSGAFGGGNGNNFAAKPKYVMRMRNPKDMSDMGVVTMPSGGGNDLIGFSPSPSAPMAFPLPVDSSAPFTIAPGAGPGSAGAPNGDNSNSNSNANNGNDGDDGDDGAFAGPRRLLAAVPHKKGGDGDLKPGSGNYALLGMASPDQGGLLHLDINAILNADPSLPTTDDNDSDPSQLLDVSALASAPGVITAAAEGTVDVTGNGSNVPDLFGPAQNAWWTFHPRSSRLLAHFVNSDGSTVPTYFVTGGACHHTICLTGDVEAFKNEYGSDALEVHVLATADL